MFPEPRFDVAIGTVAKQFGTTVFEPWTYKLEPLEPGSSKKRRRGPVTYGKAYQEDSGAITIINWYATNMYTFDHD